MNERELCERLGIVWVRCYWRRLPCRPNGPLYMVSEHYRAAPGTGPL